MRRPIPISGIWLATIAVLILTPDTMLMRWSGFDGWAMLAWRGILMGVGLLALWLITSRRRAGDIAALLTTGGIGVAICQLFNSGLFAVGIGIAPVSVVLFGVATVPVWSSIFAYILAGERTGRTTWITTAVVLLGIGIAVLGGEPPEIGRASHTILGALCGLGVAASLAFSFVIFRKHTRLPILLVIGVGALGSGFVGLGIGGVEGIFDGVIWAIVLAGGVVLPVSFVMLSIASRHTHATNVSLLLLLETILGPAWVWAGTGEALTPAMWIGGAIVVISLAVYILALDRA